MPMTTVLYIRQLLRRHPVIVILSVLMVLHRGSVAVNRGGRPKKTKCVVYVATEHLDTISMQFRASPAKLSFGAMHTKAWYIYCIFCVDTELYLLLVISSSWRFRRPRDLGRVTSDISLNLP